MAPATISNVRDFIEVMVSAVSVLGVFMAWERLGSIPLDPRQ